MALATSDVPLTDLPVRLQRATGELRLGLRAETGRSAVAEYFQSGASKIRMPRAADGRGHDAVIMNTAGGLTGGDAFACTVTLAAETSATVTTPACERVYRARDGVAKVENNIFLGPNAALDWLPQETILYDGGALERRFDADIAADARLLAVEAVVLGRTAHGEAVRRGYLGDSFRIRRGGRLIHADRFRLDGDIAAAFARPALGGGAVAFATCLYAAPDAGATLDAVRALPEAAGCEAGASALDGLLLCRLVARDAAALRRHLVMLLHLLRGRAIPRLWSC